MCSLHASYDLTRNLVGQADRRYAGSMDREQLVKALRRAMRKAKRKIRRMPKRLARLGKRVAKRAGKKAVRRTRKTAGFLGRLFKAGPRKLTRRWFRRKTRRTRTRTVASTRKFRPTGSDPRTRRGGRHDIVPGRTVIEWRTHPELGRGRVLAFLPGRNLDVLFDAGGRPPNGVPIEEVRVLA